MFTKNGIVYMLAGAILMVTGGCTPGLVNATNKNDVAAVQRLLNEKANPDVRDRTESTPLHLAAQKGLLEIAKALIAGKADVNLENKSGKTPLHYAAAGGHDDIVLALLNAGADPNAKPTYGGLTPLRCAIRGKKSSTAKLLLEHGAEPGTDLKVCVEDALKAEMSDCLALLLQRPDAILDQRALDGLLSTALGTYNAANIAVLLDKGADPRQATYEMTLLLTSYATEESSGVRSFQFQQRQQTVSGPAVFGPVDHKDATTLEKFIAIGCDVNVQDSAGRTLTDFAKEHSNEQVMAVIRKHALK